MEDRFLINPLLFAAGIATALFSFLMCVVLLLLGRWGSAAIFGILFCLFVYVAAENGILICISEQGIFEKGIRRGKRKLPWREIHEIGICGTKVFGKYEKVKNFGTLYIYFSEKKMDDNERFGMILRWPPSNKNYMLYSKKRLMAVQRFWGGEIGLYNVEDIE